MDDERKPNPYPPEVKALNAALAKAQGEFPSIQREKNVTVRTRDGASYSFAYAPLDAILSAVRPVLSANGLALVQRLESPNGHPSIRTELLHAEGAVLAASFPLGEMPASPQQLGSLLTYLRRYAIVSLLGLAAEDDDDGNRAASSRQTATAARDTGPEVEESPFVQPELRDAPAAEDVTAAQRGKIFAIRTKLKVAGVMSDAVFDALLLEIGGVDSVSGLSKSEASQVIQRLVSKENELGA